MKGLAVSEEGILSIVELPMPTYGECQALVKTQSCGVCNGTDMKLIHKSFKNFNTYPAVLGHEAVGEVVEIGSKVKNLKVGDKVLLPFLEEKVGEYYPGWGAYSEYAIVGDVEAYIENGMGEGTKSFSEGYYAQTVLKPTDNIDVVEASMIITFREVLSAIRRFDFKPNSSIIIFGAGPVGLCFTQFSKLLGMKTVITVDLMDEKLETAKALGADYVWNSKVDNISEKTHELFPEGVDYVVDAVGINQLINQAMELIKYNGKICCYGISSNLGMDLDWSKAPYNWSLQFVQWPSKKEEADAHEQIMAWINCGVLRPMDYISDIFSFENILEAFSLVEQRKSTTKKIVIRYDAL